LSVWAVITASQQTTLINAFPPTDRLSLEEVYSTAQIILRYKTDLDDVEGYASSFFRGPEALGKKGWSARNIIYVWQCPLMMMSWAWGSLLIGLTLHVCAPLIAGDATKDETRVRLLFSYASLESILISLPDCYILPSNRSGRFCQLPLDKRINLLDFKNNLWNEA